MKKRYLFLCLTLLLGISAQTIAQTDPGLTNLRHQWTFDNGPDDVIGGLVGTLEGAATISNKALNTTAGGFFSMPAAQIAINTYQALTLEVWFTPSAGVNTGFTMLTYFGATTGTIGTDYTFISTARGDNVSRAAIVGLNSSNPWATENGVNGTEYDDGRLRHMVSVITDETISFYIDGVNQGSAMLSENNKIQNISTMYAYLCKAGYTGDPTWRGNIHKFSIYDKALNDNEVLYIFQQGPEEEEVLTATVSSVALDTNYPAEMFNVSGVNLGNDITITAPAGISVFPASLSRTAKDEEVYVVWDGAQVIDGDIVLTSGANEVKIKVKTADDTECYVPLYDDVVNIVTDPGLNSLAHFGGWGTRDVSTIVTDPDNVYCGASSVSVGDGIGAGSGSLDVVLTGNLMPNTFYRVKAMVKTVDGTFQLGVWGWSAGQGDINNVIDTQGEWMPIDFTFTTGTDLGATQGMFWNNWACTGTKGYIDNWEMYEAPDPQLSISRRQAAFDPEYTQMTFTVTGGNLTEGITITTPAGITASATSLPAEVLGEPVVLLWDGTTPVDGEVLVVSSGISLNIVLKSTSQSNLGCFVPLYTDKTNLIDDPFLNDMSNFSGWGGRSLISIVDKPDSVYCGSHSGRVMGGGSLDVIITGKIEPNRAYLARAMVMTIGGAFQMGVWGMDALTPGDVQDSIDTQGTWMPMVLEFATGEILGDVQGMFFNNYQRTGRAGYIDNWELYDMGALSVINPTQSNHRVYINNGRIVAEFDMNNAAVVDISVYSLQGTLVAQKSLNALNGRNREELDAMMPSGVYLVKISSEGKHVISKVIR